MDEEVEELAEFWASLNEIEKHRYRQAKEDGEKDFQRLKQDFETLEDLNMLKITLVMLEEKNGTVINQKFDDKKSLNEFAKFLTDQGLHVWTGIGIEKEEFVYTEVFASNEPRSEDFIDEYRDLRDRKPVKYHREMGNFFGYPEDSIEAFIEKPSIFERAWNFIAYRTPLETKRSGIIGKESAIKKYGENLSKEEERDLRTLIFYMLKDSEESFRKAVETAGERRKALEDLETDFTEFQDSYLELLDGFGN